ncbi:hypothetical protein [Rhodococcus sp. NPDC058514]|uniref:hypothetical protein n=1 Tax=unclassified Rhodococcus (in: high G+C Gram-positive bacteria) TaxID=192944 RepID=UPI003661D9BC
MILDGLGRTAGPIEFLREPNTGWQQFFSTLAWIALSVAGWIIQRRLFAEKLGIETAKRPWEPGLVSDES